jgi:hypothetical protein
VFETFDSPSRVFIVQGGGLPIPPERRLHGGRQTETIEGLTFQEQASRIRSEAECQLGEPNMSNAPPTSLVDPLWDLPPESPIWSEWNLFRREWPRLLAEGHEGSWVLIKGEEIIGVFATREEARGVGLRRFGLTTMLIQQILRWYKPLQQGYSRQCQP